MTCRRRPVRGRTRGSRRVRRDLNFPRLRTEVMLVSKGGLILNQADFLREGKVANAVNSESGSFCH